MRLWLVWVSSIFLFILNIGSAETLKQEVLVAYSVKDRNHSLLKAVESVLQEEGVPYRFESVFKLIDREPGAVSKTSPVIILPDGVNKHIPADMKYWFRDYVNGGGSIFVIYDVGVKTIRDKYRKEPVLAELVGVNYCTYEKKRDRAYILDHFRLKEFAFKDIDIPPGKTIDGYISSYKYGKLKYPTADTEVIDKSIVVLAETGRGNIGASLKDYGRGKVFFVNLPLCHLKANADDLPLRMFLRYFLFKVVGIPHLLNVPLRQRWAGNKLAYRL